MALGMAPGQSEMDVGCCTVGVGVIATGVGGTGVGVGVGIVRVGVGVGFACPECAAAYVGNAKSSSAVMKPPTVRAAMYRLNGVCGCMWISLLTSR